MLGKSRPLGCVRKILGFTAGFTTGFTGGFLAWITHSPESFVYLKDILKLAVYSNKDKENLGAVQLINRYGNTKKDGHSLMVSVRLKLLVSVKLTGPSY